MGNKAVRLDGKGKILTVDDTVYTLTPGLLELITNKHPRPDQYNSNDERVYRSLVAQTRVKSFPNRTGGARQHATWEWMQLLKKIVMPGERIAEGGSEDTDDESDTASVGDTESSDITSPDSTLKASDVPSSSDYGIPPPARTRDYGKAKKTKKREPFYRGYEGRGVVYLPGDINGLTKKLHLLAAEFLAGNTTVRNELVHVLDALLRLKQLTCRYYRSFRGIIMIVYNSRCFTVRRYKYEGSGIVSTIGSLLARYATKAMLTRAAKTAMRGSLDAAKRVVPHLIAHKVAGTITDAVKKQERVDNERETKSRAHCTNNGL